MNIISKTTAVLAMLGLGATCGLGAASSFGTTTVSGTVTLKQPQYDNYFVYDANNGALTGALPGPGAVPAGTYPLSQTVNTYITSGFASLIGLYQPGGVSIAVNEDVFNAALNTETWTDVFPGSSEASISTALTSGDTATLLNFLQTYSGDFVSYNAGTTFPISGGILEFSNATDGGSVTVDSIDATCSTPPLAFIVPLSSGCGDGGGAATPEPATELLLGLGLGVVALTARKLRKA